MSMISLVATDQLLSVALQPTIATGDKNSVQLNVEFSEEWDGYARSAVFFHSIDTDMIYEMILVNGQCTVPHEVLTESGVLYIGVRGVNSDKFVKTSTLVKYKIKEGAPSGTGTTVEPTADVYQQLLSAYGDMEKYIVEEIDKVKVSGIQRTPLFANNVEECTDTTLLYVLPDGFIYAYMYFEDRIKYYTNLATTFENGALDSQGAIVPQGDAITCTDYIPCGDEAVVRIKGFGALDDCNVIFYNQAQEVVAARQFTTDVTDTISYSYDEASETATITSNSSDITYLRVSGILAGKTNDVIITVDEVIMETVIPNYDWKSTGHSLVPADYDGRMEGLSKEIDVERKRINKIVSLPEGSTTGDAELQDIRIGADGTVYESAGEAVRRQISDLKKNWAEDKTEIIAELAENETFIDNVSEIVKEEVPFVKVAEQPTIVDSVDDMTDTSQYYVLSTDGFFYGYREAENYNLFKISEVSFSSRLQDDVEGITSSTTGNFVTGWIPVKYGKYYGASILFEGERKIKNINYQRANLKLSDGTIIVYNKGKVPYVAIDGCKILDIKYTNAVAIQLHFTISNDSESILDTPNANVLSNYKPMMVDADTPEDAYQNAINLEYIDGDAESVAEWTNTGLAYNQPADYEQRIVNLETDVEELKENATEPEVVSPYCRNVNFGVIPYSYYKGVGISYSTEDFQKETTYASFIAKWKSLVANHSGHVTETELGVASDGQPIYSYNFKPVRISNQKNDIPKIIIIAGQHGFEKSNIYGLYYFVDNLLNRWTEHPTLEYLRNHVELLIVPVLNTYGFDHLEYKNANGVNLNRNYDSNWVLVEDTTDSGYGGTSPFDQPETQIVRDLLNNNKDASLVIDFHTNGGASVTKYEDVNWCAICPNTDTYYNRMLDAVSHHLSALTAHFNLDYALNQPNVMMGHMTTNSGTGLLRSWATENNFVGVLIEGFNGFPKEEHFIGRVYKANEEIIANYLITALSYLSK